jgi:hypothetical protein
MGTSEIPSHKSHESDISLGEGLEYNAVHVAHNKHTVKEAKHVMGLPAKSRAHQERRENGGADPEGCCDM